MSPGTAIVTGGSRGLGAVFVDALLDDGFSVATGSRSRTANVDRWEKAHGDRFLYSSFDMRDRAASDEFVRAVVDRFGGIDVLVNNAGLAREALLPMFSEETIDEVIDVNLRATVHFTRTVVRRMLASGAGRIVNISSIIGITGYRGLSVYGATKAALDGFTRALARELGPRGITVNSIAPGYLRTDMTETLSGDQLGQIVRRTPMGRLGTADDVVGALRYLLSDGAGFVTGQVLVVDGGLTA